MGHTRGRPAANSAVIVTEDLSYRYPDGAQALQSVDVIVRRGQVVGLVGASGAGKSTLVRVLTGLAPDFTGRVEVLHRAVRDWGPSLYARVGVAFELPTHYTKLTGRENLEFFASLQPGPTRNPQELLALVGLEAAADDRVAGYSKGMAVRLGLARSLLADPELLFLDEPTSGLDPANARRVADIIVSQRAVGGSVLVTTHDLWLAERVCDRLIVIAGGRVVATGSPEELRRQNAPIRICVRIGTGPEQGLYTFGLPGADRDPDFLATMARDDVVEVFTERSELGEVLIRLADDNRTVTSSVEGPSRP